MIQFSWSILLYLTFLPMIKSLSTALCRKRLAQLSFSIFNPIWNRFSGCIVFRALFDSDMVADTVYRSRRSAAAASWVNQAARSSRFLRYVYHPIRPFIYVMRSGWAGSSSVPFVFCIKSCIITWRALCERIRFCCPVPVDADAARFSDWI